jgi:hypothetical protein
VRRLVVLACAALSALAPAAAEAAIVPGAPVDGPSADITPNSVVQADVAPDGTAAIAYLKGATPHVWVSRLVGGAWSAPEQAESLPVASSNPRIAVANGGKVVVTFANGGNVQAVIKPSAGAPFGTPANIGTGGSYGEIDLAPNGSGYVAIKAGNVLTASRLEGTTFTPVTGDLNNNPLQEAGGSDREAKVATRSDGSDAVIAWGENPGGPGSVYVRRITGTTLGAIQDVRLPSLDGAPAQAGSDVFMPDVGIGGLGTAWVVFRQSFTYGAQNFSRAVVRPLPPAGTLGTAEVVDSLGASPTENVEYPRIDVNGAGQGLTANALGTTFGIQSAFQVLAWARLPAPVNPTANTGASFASPALAGNGEGVVAWVHDPDGAGTEVDRILARKVVGGFGPVLTLSDPTLGDLQQFQIATAAGNDFVVVGYVQGGAGGADPRRIGAAVVDLAGAGPPTPVDVTKPKLSKLKLSAKRFRLGGKLASAAAVGTGLTIRYTLSEAATVTLSFERVTRGRKVGKRCVKAKRSNRRRKACTRYAAVKPALTFRNQAAGSRRIHFEGRLSRRKTLKPGVYRLTLRARDLAGNRSAPLRAKITALPRKRKRG